MANGLPVSDERDPCVKKTIMPSMDALEPFIFQFPPTKNFLSAAILIESTN